MTVIVVTGVGGPAGRTVARLLCERAGQTGALTIVGTDMTPTELPGVRPAVVPAVSDPAFLSAMRALIAESGADLVVPTVQDELAIVSAAQMVLTNTPSDSAGPAKSGRHTRVAVSGPGPTAIASDKLLTMWALDSAGLAVPRFAPMSDFTTAQEALDVMSGPIVLKPRVSRGGAQRTHPGISRRRNVGPHR